jgi:nucleoside-diphosphate-sugar epimerase
MILIVGSKGFLGTALVDNFKKKKTIEVDKKNFTIKKKNKKKQFSIDIKDLNKLENIFKINKIKYVINLAAEPASSRSKKKIWDTNVNGNKNLINLSEKYKIRKYIFISTSALFVKNYKTPVTEKTKPIPVEIYGFSKLRAENDIIKSNLKNYAIFRCPMIVSKNRLGVLSFLFDLIKSSKYVPILGSGKNLFQFIGTKDLINVIHKSLYRLEKEIYNVASNEKISLLSLVNKLIKLINSHSKIINIPDFGFSIILNLLNKFKLSPFNIYHLKMLKYSFVMNINKIKNNYKFNPKENTSQLIKDSLIYYLSMKRDSVKTEITSPIKLGILKILYKFC